MRNLLRLPAAWTRRMARRFLGGPGTSVPRLPVADVPGLPASWPDANLLEEVRGIRWFHRLDLNGLQTPGIDPSPNKLATLGIPDDLAGQSVLDIGAWDGFFSYECERRNAARVLATDYFCWTGEGWGTKAGFDLAHRVYKSRVESHVIDVMNLSPGEVGTHDLVLFLGVLYHLKHPLLALEKVASVTRGMLILETHVDMLDCSRPAAAFYPGTELLGDPTNWFGPNPAMIESMLRTVGFRRIELHRGPYCISPLSPRVVFHAWK